MAGCLLLTAVLPNACIAAHLFAQQCLLSYSNQAAYALATCCCHAVFAYWCRSTHFSEFYNAAKGTSVPLNDNKASTATALSHDTAQHAQHDLHPPADSTKDHAAHDAPVSMAQTSLQTLSQGQAAEPAQSVAAPDNNDPQTLRQKQHTSSGSQGQADLQVRFADVGCGFGGLLVRLSPLYPDTLMVGMEIRDKVSHASLVLPDAP